ncbi:ABC transporter ATP-binding protein [Candidatus Sneabacter namystus]|uniref:ABC transporter ATP-binding protein n=1 Tax=Candidatus Sneabacter namystus TaxID=2601646 RepID=A0A5C0UHB2_9RICK|nr:ABC transporter ATP-binding protein [Candidatus Sneabacter namystus]QEK39498.1 ABC transporter ATP-binding protein [Candidatus Sneabacter namystus]
MQSQNFDDRVAIQISSLCKKYKGEGGRCVDALTDVNIEILKGSCCAILGPNGAGKSTLINILAGSVVKTSGSVKIFGFDIDTQTFAAKRMIGVVPQELNLDVFFSVRELLEIYAGYYGIKSGDRKTDHILQVLDLYDKKNSTARQLSGGMKRRLLVAKALVHSPKILVLDEPTAGVDVELREKLWKYVRQLKSQGVTVLLTTHYLYEAQELCDSFIFIKDGCTPATHYTKEELWKLSCSEATVRFDSPVTLDGTLSSYKNICLKDDGKLLTAECSRSEVTSFIKYISSLDVNIESIEINSMSLENIFKKIFFSKKDTTDKKDRFF